MIPFYCKMSDSSKEKEKCKFTCNAINCVFISCYAWAKWEGAVWCHISFSTSLTFCHIEIHIQPSFVVTFVGSLDSMSGIIFSSVISTIATITSDSLTKWDDQEWVELGTDRRFCSIIIVTPTVHFMLIWHQCSWSSKYTGMLRGPITLLRIEQTHVSVPLHKNHYLCMIRSHISMCKLRWSLMFSLSLLCALSIRIMLL